MYKNNETEQECTNFRSNWDEKIDNFRQMNLMPELLEGIFKYGYNEPTEIQELSIVPIIKGNNIIAKSPYRLNQMISYVIGILQRINISEDNKRVLILTTTDTQVNRITYLFNQIGAFILELKIAQLKRIESIDQQKIDEINHSQIIISTQEYALEYIQNKSIVFDNINIVCINESDQLFGEELYKKTNEILSNLNSNIQIITFLTSITNKILDKMEEMIPNPVKIEANNDSRKLKNVRQFYVETSAENDKFQQLYDLCKTFNFLKVIIVTNKIKTVEFIYTKFQKRNFNFPFIHQGIEKEKRKEIIKEFFKRKSGVLISDYIPKNLSENVIAIFFGFLESSKIPETCLNNIIISNKFILDHIEKLPQNYLGYFIDYDLPEIHHIKHYYFNNNNQQQMIDNLIYALNLVKDCKVVIY